MLIETLKRHWWVPVLRGILAILFGIVAFAYPGLTAATLVIFFGAWILVDGVFRIIAAIGHRASDPEWGFHLIIGILGIIVGLLAFHAPVVTALALVIYIAVWVLMIGATEIAFAIKVRREVKGEWLLILLGLLSIAFAVLLLWNPLLGAATLIWLIAWYAIVFGILGIILGFRLRSLPTIPVR
ncbi:MAG TPA: HdeD family acid-resistance protein [Verrucomicrobiae bacterium]|nr:HdeD family acid-resistance protein [Verrucomicrobiae bacterium]